MASYKCCVGGCDTTTGSVDTTNNTHKLFCMPRNDSLRNLWMSFIAPSNPGLLGLSKNQLMKKRVCSKHFDETQFDGAGVRIRHSYPCLISQMEIHHGVPLTTGEYNVVKEHNYFGVQELDDTHTQVDAVRHVGIQDDISLMDHEYTLPQTSESNIIRKLPSEDVVSLQDQQSSLRSTNQTSPTPELQHQGRLFVNLADETKSENKNTPHINTGKSIKQFNSKSRQYIKKCTKFSKESLGETSTQRLQNAQKLADNSSFMMDFDKLNKRAKSFLLMQLRLSRKNKMARRFTLEDKIFALTLLKQSPKGYKLLENMFALPNKRTLTRLSGKIIFECGINKNIFDHIKTTIQRWDTKQKLCSLVFDEVALNPHLIYNENSDKINGFVEIAGERRQKLADHALVFMIRGICNSWRQSIAYYFCAGTVSAAELQNILKQIVPLLFETGLIPLAMVCDQGSTFRSCFKLMRNDTARFRNTQESDRDNTIHIAGHDLFLFYDPPHLLKGIRNNFLEKDILFQGKRASWKDILYVYDIDNRSGHTRALPKLTAEHVDPKKIKKMKVKAAAQVLSARTAAMLNYTHAVHKHLNNCTNTMETTGEVVLFFDELFDSVNGSSGAVRGKMRSAVKENSLHEEFWREAITKLKNMKFIDTSSKLARNSGKPRHVRVPSLDGWIVTLESFLGLSKLLFKKFGVTYFYPRNINQDPLENFFGRIRALNSRNTNPDVNAFVYSFKSLAISNILSPQSKFSNCEEDDGESIISLNYLFSSSKMLDTQDENVSINKTLITPSSSKVAPETNSETVIAEKVRVQTSAYTAGYVCRKITKKFNCNLCTKTYTTKEVQGIHKYIQYREYKRLKNSNLAYPNERILILYRESSQAIHDFLNDHCHEKNIKHKLKIIISKTNMSWLGCKTHAFKVKNYFTTLLIRLQCHNWCNIINKILEGKLEEKYVMKMHKMQRIAFEKYKIHRLRKLKLNK